MKAAILVEPREIAVRDVDIRAPEDEEVEIHVEACGICGSDLHGWRHPELTAVAGGPQVGIAGHEVVGRIAGGERVIVEPTRANACGACAACLADHAWFCRERSTIPAWGFAERMVVPRRATFPVPPHLDAGIASVVEPLACAVHAIRHSWTARAVGLADTRVVVLGAGVSGLVSALAAIELGASRVLVTARHPHQRRAADDLGAEVVADDADQQLLKEFAPGLVIEAVGGMASTFDVAMRIVAPAGEVAVLGLFEEVRSLDTRRAGYRGTRLFFPVTYGALDGVHDFSVALDIAARRPNDLARLVTNRFALDDVAKAFEVAADKRSGCLKVVVGP